MGDDHIVKGLIDPLGLKDPAAGEASRMLEDIFSQHIRDVCDDPGKVTLHHYTNASGVIGMLKQHPVKMWASLATHLNDDKELRHGQNLVWEKFQHHRHALEALNVSWEDVLKPENAWTNIFVTSFTEKGDSLGQWRGYSGKRGYALTFELGALPTDIPFAKVIYDDDVSVLEKTFVGLVELYRTYCAGVEPAKIEKSLQRGLALAAALYKAPSWKEEREWRLVQWCETADHHEFRENNGRLVPYHLTDLPNDLKLKAITVGPGHDYEMEKSALELVLEKHEKESSRRIPVLKSDSSLRVS